MHKYAHDSVRGEAANRLLLDNFHDQLLTAWIARFHPEDSSAYLVEKSLTHPQAQVWAREDEPEVEAVVQDRRNKQEIIFERWQKAVAPTSKARWGMHATEAERPVIGAWLSMS